MTWRRRDDSDDSLIEGVLARDEETIRTIVDEFGPHLVQVAGRYLYGKARGHVEPEEVVQSALGSFFRHDPSARFEIGTFEELWSLLVVITRRKCRKQRRYWSAARRSVVTNGPPGSSWPEPVSDEDPAAQAELRELIDRTLERFEGHARPIVELSLLGLDTKAIAAEQGRSERTVQRVRNGLRCFLRDELKSLA